MVYHFLAVLYPQDLCILYTSVASNPSSEYISDTVPAKYCVA